MATALSCFAAAAAAVLLLILSSSKVQLGLSLTTESKVDHPSNISSFFPSPSAAAPPSLNDEGFPPVPTSGEFIGKKSSSSSKTVLVNVDHSPVMVVLLGGLGILAIHLH